MPNLEAVRIGVVGLGYVGLPLATAFGRGLETVGYDLDSRRIEELRKGHDRTRETPPQDLAAAKRLTLTDRLEDLASCNVFIVTVPTPIDAAKRPDLGPLLAASRAVGSVLKKGDVVVYESTVYPGATEEVCVPELEAASGLKFNVDFFCGYSPERINPGDREHRLATIVKVTSGSTPEIAELVDALYASIVTAGTFKSSSIRVAEAAKVIENTQRDVNIALINELAILFNKLGIDSLEVLEAAGTKWNFLGFRPGLVGGHCIGVDPYYLTHKAQEIGHHAEVILAGRRINDAMGAYVAERVVRLMAQRGISAVGARVLILGFSFKENCPDLRNTRVIDIVRTLADFGALPEVADPLVDPEEAVAEYGVELVSDPRKGQYDAVILAAPHREFVAMGAGGLRAYGRPGAVLYDVKSVFPRTAVDDRL